MYSAFVTFWHTSNFPCVCTYVHTQGQKNSLVSVDNKWNRYTEHKMIFSSNLNTTDIPSIWHWRYSHRCLTAQTIQERGWWQFRTVWHRFHRAVYKNVLPWFECSMIWLWKFPLVNSSNCSPSVPQVFPSCYRECVSNLCTSAHHIGFLPTLFWKLPTGIGICFFCSGNLTGANFPCILLHDCCWIQICCHLIFYGSFTRMRFDLTLVPKVSI